MDMMAEHAEGLAVQRMFPDAVEMVQRRLRRPADAERAMHMGLRPVEYGAQFVPIAYRFERKLLHRRPGDDEAVEPLVPHVAPRPVDGRHLIGGGVARHMVADPPKRKFALQGRRAYQPGELRPRRVLFGDLRSV